MITVELLKAAYEHAESTREAIFAACQKMQEIWAGTESSLTCTCPVPIPSEDELIVAYLNEKIRGSSTP